MTGQFRSKFSFKIRLITVALFIMAAVFIMVLVFGVAGYAQSPTPRPGAGHGGPTPRWAYTPKPTPSKSMNVKHAQDILTRVGKLAEDTFYSCIFNGYMQGLPLKQAQEQCSTQLIEDDKNGFGEIRNVGGNKQQSFGPTEVSVACNSGDPKLSQASGGGLSSGWAPVPGYGGYSWGEKSNTSKGLSEQDSKKMKDELLEEAKKQEEKFLELEKEADAAEEALKEAKATGDKTAIAKAQAALKEAKEKATKQAGKALDASKDAEEDPNKEPPKTTRTVEESRCEAALAAAREFLRECNRNGWKSSQCQQFQAKMNKCPDPTLILVDPDQGYTCGGKPDAATVEAIKDAWVARCEENKKFGPDTNPCERPTLDRSGRRIKGKIGDVCNDPHALITPDADVCAVTFHVSKTWGETDIQDILILALNKLGGPIFVLPRNPEPPPGPAPPTKLSPGPQ